MRFASLGLIIIGTGLHGAANYIGPVIAFALVSLILPMAVAVEIDRKASTTSGVEPSGVATGRAGPSSADTGSGGVMSPFAVGGTDPQTGEPRSTVKADQEPLLRHSIVGRKSTKDCCAGQGRSGSSMAAERVSAFCGFIVHEQWTSHCAHSTTVRVATTPFILANRRVSPSAGRVCRKRFASANRACQVSGYPVTGCRSISPLVDSRYQVPMSSACPVA